MTAPRKEDAAHRMQIRVYYEDTDLAGIVYYANYLKYFERGRTELLRVHGIDQGALKAESGLVFVVTRVAVDYLAPARFDDLLEVTTALDQLGRASARLLQAAWRGDTCLVRGTVALACIDATGRPRRFPEPVRAALGANG